jgi:hypothetical protein
VNAVSRMGQPPEGTASSNNASRRTFLKGVGLATAAGVAAPLLAATSARAATVPVILGADAPGPWEGVGNTPWLSAVPGAPGCRSYVNDVWTSATQILDFVNGRGFPGEQHSKPLASIRVDPDTFLNSTDLDDALTKLIINGAEMAQDGYFAAPPQLTVWHEAGHLYKTGSAFDQYNLAPLDAPDGTPTNGAAAERVRRMHVKMQNLCDAVKSNQATRSLPHIDYGCIIYGDIEKMANDNDLDGPTNWVPKPAAAAGGRELDWYGIDIYRTSDGPGKDCTHDDLTSPAAVSQVMDRFHAMVMNRTTVSSPHINVCECNADVDQYRPQFFTDLANWLHNNDGRRMLTFWHDDPAPHGGPWSSASETTIKALQNIVSTDS